MAYSSQNGYKNGGNQNGYNNRKPQGPSIPEFDVSSLNKTNYVKKAEEIIRAHQKDKNQITANQIRNLLELINEIYEIVRMERIEKLNDELVGRVQYTKMRFVYAAGRNEKGVRYFMDRTGLIACLDSIGDNVEQFRLVCKYMEALVAYHKYYIDKK